MRTFIPRVLGPMRSPFVLPAFASRARLRFARPWRIGACLAAFVAFFAGDDEYVRWTLLTPAASPYHLIRYEVTRRQPATTAVHRRQLPDADEGLHALGLLTREESDSYFARVRALDAGHLADAKPAGKRTPGALTWRCETFLDGEAHAFEVTAMGELADRRYAQLFRATRDVVLEHAGELPFRNTFFPAKQRSWLNVESIPASKVTIDGFDTHLETPLYAYEVAAGEHVVILESTDGRYKRDYRVKLEAEGTTTLRVDLR